MGITNRYNILSKQSVLKTQRWYQPTFNTVANYPPLSIKSPKTPLIKSRWSLRNLEREEKERKQERTQNRTEKIRYQIQSEKTAWKCLKKSKNFNELYI